MSNKELRKVHIDNKEYIYVIRKTFSTGNSVVNVYESGNKSNVFCWLSFEEYTPITPSMVKEGIIKYIADKNISK
jgi:hypothetical protein